MSGVGTGSGLWYKGDLFLALYSNNVLGAFKGPVNGLKVELQHKGDPKRRISSGIDDFGQSKDLKYMPKPTEFMLEVDEISRDLLAAMVLGTGSSYTRSADTAQEATVVLVRDAWVPLPHQHVGNVAIAGLAEGTDFAVHAHLGMIKSLSADGDGSQDVTYDIGAIAGDKIIGGTDNVIEMSLKLEVENNSDGQRGFLLIPKVSVNPDAAMTFLGATDFQSLKFGGEVIKLAGQDLYTFYPAASLTDVPAPIPPGP